MYVGDLKVLESEIAAVQNNAPQYVFPDFAAIIHTPKIDINIDYLLKITNERNYQKDLAENYVVDFIVSLGTYVEDIFPYKDSLEITIFKNGKPKRFKAVIMNMERKVDNSLISGATRDDLDKLDVVRIKLQCIDPIIMVLKQLLISGIYRDITLDKLIAGLHGQSLSTAKISGKPIKHKISIKELNNKAQYKHVVIPTNTKLAKLVTYLQTGDYGLYNGDAGYFVYRNFNDDTYNFYVYPMYDYTRYEKEKDAKLMLLDSRYYQTNFTDLDLYYDSKANAYKIPVSNIDIKNKGVRPLFDTGDTIYEMDPDITVDPNSIAVSDTDVTYDTYGTINEYRVRPDVDGLHSRVPTDWDDNVFKYRSGLFLLMENVAMFTLPLIDDTPLKPGMLVKYMYARKDTTNVLRGVLQYVNTEYNIINKTTSTVLTLVLEREVVK